VLITLVQPKDSTEVVQLELLLVLKQARSHTLPGLLPQTIQSRKQPTKLEIPVPPIKISVATQPITSAEEQVLPIPAKKEETNIDVMEQAPALKMLEISG